jgi:ankyrin repeat protein
MNAPEDLVAAVKAGDTAAVRAAVAGDPAQASAQDENGLSLILLALFHHQREACDALLAADPPLDVLEAASLGRVDRLRELLATDPDAQAARTPEGFDPIGLAAFLGGADAVAVLLEHGADPDGDVDNPMRAGPLHAATAVGDSASVRVLLEAGADPDARQQGGFTPLQAAAHVDDVESARLLLEHGADVGLRNDEGRDAAALAGERVAALLRERTAAG